MNKEAIIKHCPKKNMDDRPAEKQKWCLFDSDGEKLLGRHPSKEKAQAQERAVQFFKHRGEVMLDAILKEAKWVKKASDDFIKYNDENGHYLSKDGLEKLVSSLPKIKDFKVQKINDKKIEYTDGTHSIKIWYGNVMDLSKPSISININATTFGAGYHKSVYPKIDLEEVKNQTIKYVIEAIKIFER